MGPGTAQRIRPPLNLWGGRMDWVYTLSGMKGRTRCARIYGATGLYCMRGSYWLRALPVALGSMVQRVCIVCAAAIGSGHCPVRSDLWCNGFVL